jgi:hypothetical protein
MAEMHPAGVFVNNQELWIQTNPGMAEDVWDLVDQTGKVYFTGPVKEVQDHIVLKEESGEYLRGK